jgi:LPPG:FO 2-phospho-L-lactate transferase
VVQVVPPDELTVIVNTGDDRDFFGLRVCPDLDIVTYTLSGQVRRDTGWGLEGDSFRTLDALRRFRSDVWFALGDADLATHIQRSARLREGAGLAEITHEIARGFGLRVELLPMTEDPAPTRVLREGGIASDFEEYLVRDGAPDDVVGVDLGAAARARPGPGVLEALRGAEVVLICPSNPLVSIGTIRAVPGVEAILRERRCAVAVSPIIAGRPVKGPADRLMQAAGIEVSALGIAGLYREIAAGIVIDREDAALEPAIRALGLDVRCEPTLMRDADVARRLAASVLELAERVA